MLIDKLLSPAIDVALTTLTSSAATIGTVIDLGSPRNNGMFESSNKGGWVITINGATSAGAATATFTLITSAAANLGSPTTLYTFSPGALAVIAGKGKQFFVPVPDTDDWKRYMAWQGLYATAAYTGGEISIEYTADFRKWRAYPATLNT